MLTAFPFANSVVEVTLTGQHLWDTLEGVITGVNVENGKPVTSFIQVSRGVRIEYTHGAGNGTSTCRSTNSTSSLVSVTVGDEPLDRAAEYKIVTVDFIAGGGDNIFAKPFENLAVLDTVEDVLIDHIGAESPIDISLDGRLKEVSREQAGKASRMARVRKARVNNKMYY